MAKYINVDAVGIGKARRDVFNDPAYADGWNSAIEIMQNAPAADVAPVVHAHWKEIAHEGKTTLCECTSCGDWMFFHYEYSHNYCPTCGARMDERSEDDA